MSTRTFGTVGKGVGTVIGAYLGGPVGGAVGSAIGSYVGASVGGVVSGSKTLKPHVGSHLADLSIQSSAYGHMIPIIYGTGRLAGNIVWAQPIKEVATTSQSNSGGGKGGGG